MIKIVEKNNLKLINTFFIFLNIFFLMFLIFIVKKFKCILFEIFKKLLFKNLKKYLFYNYFLIIIPFHHKYLYFYLMDLFSKFSYFRMQI